MCAIQIYRLIASLIDFCFSSFSLSTIIHLLLVFTLFFLFQQGETMKQQKRGEKRTRTKNAEIVCLLFCCCTFTWTEIDTERERETGERLIAKRSGRVRERKGDR